MFFGLFLFFFSTGSSLSLEARPPPEADFYDAFQKLKHAFNLLVKILVSCQVRACSLSKIHDCPGSRCA